MKNTIIAALALCLPLALPASAADQDRREKVTQQCVACHTTYRVN